MKETIRIQYVSEIPNIYFRSSIRILRAALRSRWEIEYDEINMSLPSAREPAIEGYDIYIFERYVPRSVPTDGVVMLVSPSTTPAGIGLRNSGSTLSGNLYLSTVEDHPIIRGMIPESIVVTKCQRLDFNDSYKILLNCGRSSALAIRNDEDYRVIVMAFELQNSDFGVRLDFSRMFYQTFEYFFPHTIDRYNFEVGESVTVNARADSLKVEGQGVNLTLTDLPTQLTLSNNGTYTLTQVITPAKTVVDSIFVKIPNRESDFSTPVEELANPYIEKPNAENEDYDLLVYIASALVLFLFAEWWLQSRTQA